MKAKKHDAEPKHPAPLPAFRIGQHAKPVAAAHATPGAQKTSPVDRKAYARLKRGKLKPEARIDLHGLTQAQALPALTGFILRAVADDRRLVLVITGKGRGDDDMGPIPERRGVLRHHLPHWLHSGQLAGLPTGKSFPFRVPVTTGDRVERRFPWASYA